VSTCFKQNKKDNLELRIKIKIKIIY